MHTKLERLLSKSLTTMEVMAYDLVVHTGPGVPTPFFVWCIRYVFRARAGGKKQEKTLNLYFVLKVIEREIVQRKLYAYRICAAEEVKLVTSAAEDLLPGSSVCPFSLYLCSAK